MSGNIYVELNQVIEIVNKLGIGLKKEKDNILGNNELTNLEKAEAIKLIKTKNHVLLDFLEMIEPSILVEFGTKSGPKKFTS